MRILRDFKVPDFKFPKFKMDGLSNIEEMNIDYDSIKDEQENKSKKGSKVYEVTNFKTIKETFESATTKYAENTFILEKFNPKEPFKEIKYKEFRSDVLALGTALNDYLKVKDTRIIIIGENTYHWYVSYMAMLCGVGIAVPVDKELPENEIINVINRSKATAVIYSTKKKEVIDKIRESKATKTKYFIQMNSNDELKGNTVGLNYLIKQGNILLNNGNNNFSKIEIDPDEFKVLIFTSGTTSNSKGVMICNRNLAQNINAITAYVKIYQSDRLMSMLPLHHTYESTIGFLYPFAMGASISVCQGLRYIVADLQDPKSRAKENKEEDEKKKKEEDTKKTLDKKKDTKKKDKKKDDKEEEIEIQFEIGKDSYIITFNAEDKIFYFDVELKKGNKYLTNIAKENIDQKFLNYFQKLEVYLEALKQKKEEDKIDILYEEAIYSKKKGFYFLISLFVNICEKKKLCKKLMEDFYKMNIDKKNDINIDRNKLFFDYASTFSNICSNADNIIKNKNYNSIYFYGIILSYFENFEKNLKKLYESSPGVIYEILLAYISNFLNSINQDLKFYEGFIEYTINNKNFDIF